MSYFNSISRINTSDISDFIDSADPVYGTGADGSVVLDGTSTVLGMTPSSSVYSLTRDVFFQNLTINSGVRLAPNGYRIFVKGVLSLGTSSTIGFVFGYSTDGSIKQGAAAQTAVTHSLGGSADGYTATAPTDALGGTQYWTVPHQAVLGYSITASGGPVFLRGGAGGITQDGGGVVILAARYISGPVSGTASIAAPGLPPAGGGVILIVSSAASLPASVTTDVSGYNAGTVNYMQLV